MIYKYVTEISILNIFLLYIQSSASFNFRNIRDKGSWYCLACVFLHIVVRLWLCCLSATYFLFVKEGCASLKASCTTARVRLQQMSVITHLKVNIISVWVRFLNPAASRRPRMLAWTNNKLIIKIMGKRIIDIILWNRIIVIISRKRSRSPHSGQIEKSNPNLNSMHR